MSLSGFDATAVEAKLRKWFPDLSVEAVQKLSRFQGDLLKFNKTVNLIASSTEKNAESVHLADCIHAARLIYKSLVQGGAVYDFGSGNGLPGIVFGILFPEIKVVLVDRDQRKLEFCKHVIAYSGLVNISTETRAVEDLPEKSIKNVISRAFAPLDKAMMAARKPVARGGRFFHMKSVSWSMELAQVPSQLFSFWSPSLLGSYKLPDSEQEMAVVLTEKTAD